jgi:ankyrin repeat protein
LALTLEVEPGGAALRDKPPAALLDEVERVHFRVGESVRQAPSVDEEITNVQNELFAAASAGDAATLERLIGAGADADSCDRLSVTVAMRAAESGQKGAVEVLFRHGVNIITKRDHRGWTVLHYASRSGSKGLVEYIVSLHDQYRKKRPIDRDGTTIAMAAARSGSEELMVYLVALVGADYIGQKIPDLVRADNHGTTLLMHAASSGSLPTVKFLIEDERCLLDRKARTPEGKTVFMFAAESGSKVLMDYLLGASSAAESDDGERARIKQLLLARDTMGDSVVTLAARSGSKDLMVSLEARGFDVLEEQNTNTAKTTLMSLARNSGRRDDSHWRDAARLQVLATIPRERSVGIRIPE